MRLVNRSYTYSEVEISEGLGGGSRHYHKLGSHEWSIEAWLEE